MINKKQIKMKVFFNRSDKVQLNSEIKLVEHSYSTGTEPTNY